MTPQELELELAKCKTIDEKINYINANLTHNNIVALLISYIESENVVEPITVTPAAYDRLINFIETYFRVPDSKGRGRKGILNDDSLTFWDKVRKIKSGSSSTYLKQNMLAKLLERETIIREENGTPITDCIEHIMSANITEIDELEKKDIQLIQQVEQENTKIVNNLFSDGETN